jgi:hypothetical protein
VLEYYKGPNVMEVPFIEDNFANYFSRFTLFNPACFFWLFWWK